MARGVNKVILVGNLGDNPETRQTSTGMAMANFSLATSESWRDKQTGEMVERTEWHRISLFGRLAEIAGQYLRKGSKVYIEGKLQTRKWQDKQGQDRYTTEILVDTNGQLQMLDRRDEMERTQAFNPAETTSPKSASNFATPQNTTPTSEKTAATANSYEDFDDDIPF